MSVALSTGGDLSGGCEQLRFVPAKDDRKSSQDNLWLLS